MTTTRIMNSKAAGQKTKLLNRLAALLTRQTPERNIALLEHLAMTQPDNRTMTEILKAAIQDSGQSFYALGKASGVSKAQIARFMNGERDLRLASVEKLADALGFTLSSRHIPHSTANNPKQ